MYEEWVQGECAVCHEKTWVIKVQSERTLCLDDFSMCSETVADPIKPLYRRPAG